MHIGLNAQTQERDSNDLQNNKDDADFDFQVHHNDEDDYEEVQLIQNEI